MERQEMITDRREKEELCRRKKNDDRWTDGRMDIQTDLYTCTCVHMYT